MAETHFDLIVIGGGPGGYVGAIRAAQLGMKVAVIERDRLGGVCLNWGCIPTKALLKNAEIYTQVSKHADQWGLTFDNLSYDWSKVIGRSRGVADTLNKGIAFLFKKNTITHFVGHAKITRAATSSLPCEVQLSGEPGGAVNETLTAQRILISTGAVPRELPFAPFDGQTILAAKEAMTLTEQPKRLVIVGGGAIGVEFAYFYHAFGTEVTLIEMLPQLLPIEDHDIAKALEREFKKSKLKFHTSTVTTAIEKKKGGGAAVTFAPINDQTKTQTIECDNVLIAIGVRGRYDHLWDESVGIRTDRDHILVEYREVDQPTYQTTASGIYAVGDVIGPPWLAHVASEEAIACIERMAGHECVGVDYNSIPGCTYCHPEVASIGKTENTLKEEGLTEGEDYSIGKYPFKSHGKAIAAGETAGLVKLIASKPHGEILGVHIIGASATELIGEFTIARAVEATVEDIINTVHAHPTMHEAIHEVALATEGRLIHG